MKKYQVTVTLIKEYSAVDSDDAYEQMMVDIEDRAGMAIQSQSILVEADEA